MVNFHGLMLLILITIFSYTANVRASVQDFSGQSPYFRDSSGNWHKSSTFNAQLSAGKLTYEGQYRVQSPTAGRAFPVTISRAVDVDTSRLGSAVKKFAKLAGPVGVGIVLADLICSETAICEDAGQWFTQSDPAIAGYPQTTEKFFYCTGFGCNLQPGPQDVSGPTPTITCQKTAGAQSESFFYKSNTQTTCLFGRVSGGPDYQINVNKWNGCPTYYTTGPTECTLNGDPNPTLATDQDWDENETTMNDPAFIEPMYNQQQELPIGTPDPFEPVNYVSGEKTTTLRDSSGNITGTSVETTTLTLTDASTSSAPNQFDVKESKTVINYDINNNIIDQSTTITEGPPTIPPDNDPTDEDFEFDDMEDEELQEWEMPDVFDWESWGSGSCPANRLIDYSYGSLELSYEPACTFATDVKPIILIIAGIIAMYIISGIRTE